MYYCPHLVSSGYCCFGLKLKEQLLFLRHKGGKLTGTVNNKYHKLKHGMITTKTGLVDCLNKISVMLYILLSVIDCMYYMEYFSTYHPQFLTCSDEWTGEFFL
jgi:hypothetical protein